MSDKLRVMVIDDEPDIRSIHRYLLQKEYDVVEAENGLDALMKLEEYEPDLLLVDVMMPVMDGLAFAKNVRANPRFNRLPMIFLTSLDSAQDIRKGYESGADVYLTKPANLERLRKNIQSFIDVDGLRVAPKKLTLDQIKERETAASKTIAEHVAAKAKAAKEGPVLPAAASEAPAAAPAPPAKGAPAAKPARPAARGPAKPLVRVFAVDDDPSTLGNLAQWIADSYEVVTTARGIDFLRKIPRYEPDVVVIGGASPTTNGFQLLSILRRCQALAMTPTLFIVSQANEKQANYALAQGADYILPKPLNPGELRIQMKRATSQMGFRVKTPKSMTLEQIHELEKAETPAPKSEAEAVAALNTGMKGAPGKPETKKKAAEVDTGKALREFYKEVKDKEP